MYQVMIYPYTENDSIVYECEEYSEAVEWVKDNFTNGEAVRKGVCIARDKLIEE